MSGRSSTVGFGAEANVEGGAVVHPTLDDPFVRGLSQPFGGPLGQHAVPPRRRFWTPVRIVLALACLVFAVHWLQKSPCQSGAWVDLMQYRNFCYSDVLALYYAEHLNEGAVPYRDWPVEYPVLTGAFMGILGLPIHSLAQDTLEGINEGQWFYNLNALVLSTLGVATVAVLLNMRRNRPWDVAMLALAPAMVFTATVNWDLLAVSLTAFAMLAWARKRPIAAGVLLGLATAAKFYPLLIIGPLVLLGLRSRQVGAVINSLLAAGLTWFAVNAPVMLLWRDSWMRFFELNSERPIDWGTLWYIGAHFPTGGGEYGLEPFESLGANIPQLNLMYFVLFALCCVGIGALALFAPRRPRLAALAFLTIAAFLIVGKVWSQQYVLWLIPLAVLARPRWGAFLVWQAAEVGYFFAFYGELMAASGQPVFPEWVFVLASSLRLVTLCVLCGFVVRDILKPEQDAVRASGADDPDGGVFDGTSDAPWVRRLQAWIQGRETEPTAAEGVATTA